MAGTAALLFGLAAIVGKNAAGGQRKSCTSVGGESVDPKESDPPAGVQVLLLPP
jgi:hypothetical protein